MGKYTLIAVQSLPDTFNLMSSKQFNFACECGRISNLRGSWVVSGNTQSCGKCDWRLKWSWIKQSWGSLRLDEKQKFPPEWVGHSAKFMFICDCGRYKRASLSDVIRGFTLSCGRCNWKSKNYWLSQKWAGLRIDPDQRLPEEWGVTRKLKLICNCGGKITSNLFNVIDGRTVSCGCSKGQGMFSPESKIRQYVASLSSDTYDTAYRIPNTRKQ